MVQHFEKFLGLPEDLVARLNAIKTAGGKVTLLVTTDVAATYLIVWES